MRRAVQAGAVWASAAVLAACGGAHPSQQLLRQPIGAGTHQLVVVVTPDWNAISGTLYRFARTGTDVTWRAVGEPIPVVVGRTGLAWGIGVADWRTAAAAGEPVKREGDGRSPAGVFALGTAFGFAPGDSVGALRVAYQMLTPETECVDDRRSVHYNTLVERAATMPVDWSSAEHMRSISEYSLGMVVDHNAQSPTPGGGSCVFLHVWDGPGVPTTGCTAMPVDRLTTVIRWLDAAQAPLLVELPRAVYDRRRHAWAMPPLTIAVATFSGSDSLTRRQVARNASDHYSSNDRSSTSVLSVPARNVRPVDTLVSQTSPGLKRSGSIL